MEVTAEKLAKMLKSVNIASSSRDHDLGWNNALIHVMNILSEPDLKTEARALLPESLNSQQITEIVFNISKGESLQAVKNIKDWTGLGLKEAKDVVDKFRDQFSKEKADALAKELTIGEFTQVK
jgi:ribosomal protein L7/L12